MNVLKLINVSAIRGGRTILSQLSFQLEEGMTGIAAASGCGKTTLAELACGYGRPAAGSAEINGKICLASRHAVLPRELTLRAGMRLQGRSRENNAAIQRPSEPIKGVIPLDGNHRPEKLEKPENTERLLGQFGLEQAAGAKWSQLTAAQKAAGALVLALAGCPDALVCDDITAGLTDSERTRLLQQLQEWTAQQNCPVLFITGNESDLLFAQRRYALKNGELKEMSV